MKIIHKDLKKGIIKIKAQNLDDLWYLSHIIDKGDLISGKTERKIQLGTEKSRQVKKLIFVTLKNILSHNSMLLSVLVTL